MKTRPPRIAVAVLDWGLGHAARSVRIVRALEEAGVEVTIASSGPALALLRGAFPTIGTIELPAYGVRYPTGLMTLDLLIQAPRVARAIAAERRIAASLARAGRIDAIVSDSRFGFVSPAVPSILVGNQFEIQSHRAWQRRAANAILGRWIRAFDTVWVVDDPGPRLTGALAGPFPGSTGRYVGVLSPLVACEPATPPVRVLALLSGPEPQRTRLERRLAASLDPAAGRTLLVRGTRTGYRPRPARAGVETIDFVDSGRLGPLVAAAEVVVARPGYGTISDCYRMGARAVLVPTPGQTEQAFLARRQVEMGRAVVLEQRDVAPRTLEDAIARALALPRPVPVPEESLLDDAVRDLVARIGRVTQRSVS